MFDLIPEGRYRAVAVQVDTDDGPAYVQFGYTKEDVRQVAVTFEILGHEAYTGEQADHVGEKLTWFGFFKTPKSSSIAIKALRMMGFKGDDFGAISEQELNSVVSIVVGHDEYDGKTRAKVQWVNDPNGGQGFKMAKTMDKTSMRRFAAEMKQAVKSVPESDGEKVQPISSVQKGRIEGRTEQEIANDDIPF